MIILVKLLFIQWYGAVENIVGALPNLVQPRESSGLPSQFDTSSELASRQYLFIKLFIPSNFLAWI